MKLHLGARVATFPSKFGVDDNAGLGKGSVVKGRRGRAFRSGETDLAKVSTGNRETARPEQEHEEREENRCCEPQPSPTKLYAESVPYGNGFL